MAITTPLPKAEAKVIVRYLAPHPDDPKNMVMPTEWRDCLDIEPIEIPVENEFLNTTDVYDERVIRMLEAILELDTTNSEEFDIVWTATNRSVKGCCPECDDIFPIAEGAPGDELNEGFIAVWCGCEDDSADI